MMELATLEERRLKDGVRSYVMRWWKAGKRKSESLPKGTTKRQADRAVARLAEQLAQEADQGPERNPLPLGDFLDDSLARMGQRKPKTMKKYQTTVKLAIEYFAGVDVHEIAFEDAERFQQWIGDRNARRPLTINGHSAQMRAIWNLAMKRSRQGAYQVRTKEGSAPCEIKYNPFIGQYKHKSEESDWRWYQPADVQNILRASSDLYWEGMVLLAYQTALRLGELLNLTWRDVDFASKEVTVSPKAGTGTVWIFSAKDHERRTLPLTDEAVDLLVELQEIQPARHPYVFVRPDRYRYIIDRIGQDQAWSPEEKAILNNFRRNWDRFRTRAGIETGTFHALRKSCISNWLDRGVPIQEAQILAGHSCITTTRRYYVRVQKESAKRKAREAAGRDTLRTGQTIPGRLRLEDVTNTQVGDTQVLGVQSVRNRAPVAQQDRAPVS